MAYTLNYLKALPSVIERINTLNDTALHTLLRLLELSKVVFDNYSHIQDVEELEKCFDNYESDYHRQYHPLNIVAYRIARDILRWERSTRYNKEIYEMAEYVPIEQAVLLVKERRSILQAREQLDAKAKEVMNKF